MMKIEIKAPPRSTRDIIIQGVTIPSGVIVADLSAQGSNNSYGPPLYYADFPFKCAVCGVKNVWTAEQQWQYFEVWKKNINHRIRLCGQCQGVRKRANQESTSRTREARQKRLEAQQTSAGDVAKSAAPEK